VSAKKSKDTGVYFITLDARKTEALVREPKKLESFLKEGKSAADSTTYDVENGASIVFLAETRSRLLEWLGSPGDVASIRNPEKSSYTLWISIHDCHSYDYRSFDALRSVKMLGAVTYGRPLMQLKGLFAGRRAPEISTGQMVDLYLEPMRRDYSFLHVKMNCAHVGSRGDLTTQIMTQDGSLHAIGQILAASLYRQ
jgi:hypothetical protein